MPVGRKSFQSSFYLIKAKMDNFYFMITVLLMTSGTTFSNTIWRGLRLRIPELMEPQKSYEEYYDNPSIYINPNELSREDRDFGRVPQPLCNEIRTELPASLYVPNIENADIYTFRPQKIYMVNCSRETTTPETSSDVQVCRLQQCREKFVDIDIFGKPKTVQENLWQLLMEIQSVPIACECFA